MTWFKFDDTAPDHPKVKGLTDRAFRWWVIGLSYASRYLTDGVLPKVFWRDAPKQIRAELSNAGLWDWEDPNFQIHDYLSHQTLKEDVEDTRARNREKAAKYRAKKRAERSSVTGDVTGDAMPVNHGDVTNPENREQITENREQRQTAPPAPAKPLISGQANPRDWGRIHGNHITGFCDWVCLPDFVFEEFRAKSPGPEYVTAWANQIRAKFEGQTIGEDGLRFWRRQWSDSHRTPSLKEPFSIEAAQARVKARQA